ncbi:hypothetical protein V8J88_13615 [Massilia sp. W12]|uniref:hypothetical protein n=1 Tax=Massilia sp. W12 TaxID=3126507 RepID=UPI0030D3CBB5
MSVSALANLPAAIPGAYAGALPAARNAAPPAPAGNADSASAGGVRISPQALQKLKDDANGALDQSGAMLQDLTRQALSSLGIASKAEAMGARIEFDSLKFQSKTTSSASFARFGAAPEAPPPPPNRFARTPPQNGIAAFSVQQSQETQISGAGRIILADGREFAFESTLEVSSSFAASGVLAQEQAEGLAFDAESPLFKVLHDMLDKLAQGQPGAKAADAPRGVAVGEPDPGRRNPPLFDFQPGLQQLQQGAQRLAQLLEDFQAPTLQAQA